MLDHDLVGQHLLVDFDGPDITPGIDRLIREGRIGGVILFAKNVRTPAQVRRLTGDLQAVAKSAGLPPLLVTIDQEGGVVNRLVEGFTVFPSAMAIGASGRDEDAAAAARITSRELKAVGVNTNHAPVLDVNTNPENPIVNIRAFSDDPELVARLGSAYMRAAQAERVLTTVKHFPGHGATPVDSHHELPVVTKDPLTLGREELFPFARAFRDGADGVMAAHIVFPAYDPSRPATLAPVIMKDLLRTELRFGGIAFTDSMSMRAVAAHWTRADAAVGALAAGMDVVLALGNEADQWESLEAIRKAATNGTVDRRQMLESGARIERIKAKYTVKGSYEGILATQDHRQMAQGIADRGVTLVRDSGRIPLSRGPVGVLHIGADVWQQRTNQFVDILRGFGVDAFLTSPKDAGDSRWADVVAASHSWRAARQSVVDGEDLRRSQRSTEAIPALHAGLGERLVVVGFGAPYELASFPGVSTYVAAYGPDLPSLTAAAKVLTGALQPTGRLPVTIPGLYPRGYAV